MITAAMLRTIEEAGEGVLTLTEGLEEGELLGSRLTRREVTRQLVILANALRALPDTAARALPEIDWAGWRGMSYALAQEGPAADDALWFGVSALVPATLNWLRVYKQSSPELFLNWSPTLSESSNEDAAARSLD
jgi:uncharacterized protein with HEPN domain